MKGKFPLSLKKPDETYCRFHPKGKSKIKCRVAGPGCRFSKKTLEDPDEMSKNCTFSSELRRLEILTGEK